MSFLANIETSCSIFKRHVWHIWSPESAERERRWNEQFEIQFAGDNFTEKSLGAKVKAVCHWHTCRMRNFGLIDF